MAHYKEMYDASVSPDKKVSDAFWLGQADLFIDWMRPPTSVSNGGFDQGDQTWFAGGALNVSACCLDRHMPALADKPCIIWEGDEPGDSKTLTYRDVLAGTCRIANALKLTGVKKGDFVTLYMPMVPETAMAMLACCRIGAPHSVVFAGFSADALRDRIIDSRSKWVCVSDEGMRGSKALKLKAICDEAVAQCPAVENVFVFKRTGNPNVPYTEGRDVHMDVLLPKMRPFCPCEPMEAEDVLFTLYTSGSTGKPKGVAHTQAGYILFAAMTTKYSFDLRPDDIYACVADVGWITGHSYIVYGPLCNGATTVMFESIPTYPDAGRYWDLVARHKISVFYTAPTAIRALMAHGEGPVKKHDRSSLRVLGSVGEPINPEAWRWYFEVVGDSRCSIADTYWQTETGGHLMTPLPGVTPMRPGSCCLPCFGVVPALLDAQSGAIIPGAGDGVLAITQPWPAACRTIWGDHERYLSTYVQPYAPYYFTGDGCKRDEDGFYWITGRVDDVLNTSGHRIGTAEVESALVAHAAVSQAAVVGYPHDVKGQGIICYVELTMGFEESPALLKALVAQVRASIGPFATPDIIIPVAGLPKTRSGKIMRRILRKVAAAEEDSLGDISTLADPSVVAVLIEKVKLAQKR
ncbi:acetyl-coenzyme A synthetase [Pelagophyceae sp. CCMP2097]|nr:acetyl-coenzyme A synthetase [Pelagophyceae sp. CCMP2097]